MSDREILAKAINKAHSNGWSLPEGMAFQSYDEFIWHDIDHVDGKTHTFKTSSLIFNHDFTKALWGEEPMLNLLPPGYEPNTYEFEGTYRWRYHLQMMVLADDPIKYLGEHL